ncbi:hypothetical protein T10_337 [Trichinella papuae]|uniref:Uncharacterized protein n=1 Tax=Trichinella papuae TaxID=268474 RepID=A0A0V1MNS7_9BILA|nr:hypothetical protein T10_337 [Trichinella papuae]
MSKISSVVQFNIVNRYVDILSKHSSFNDSGVEFCGKKNNFKFTVIELQSLMQIRLFGKVCEQ